MDQAEHERGIREAQDDIAKDAPRLFLRSRSFWGGRIADMMRDGYRVEVVYSSDVTWEPNWSFEDGYNSTIIAHLDAAYGAGTWDRIWEETWEENQSHGLAVYQK
jgi:hypothetical protein